MAMTTTFSHLSVPEDTMEMSSPANQTRDGDIDIDFTDGDFDGAVHLHTDEQMLTDGEQTRPTTATDTMMDDDLQAPAPHVQEEAMHVTPDVDQTLAIPQDDEELIDYGDEDFNFGHEVEDTTLVNVDDGLNTFDDPEHPVEHVDEEIVPQSEVGEAHADLAAVDFAEYTDHADSHDVDGDTTHEVDAEQNALQPDVSADQTDAYFQHHEHADHEEVEHPLLQAEVAADDEASSHPTVTVDTKLQAHQDGPSTPTDTGLHPMTLYYGEHAMPLFKSKNQPDGLLKDDNLASLSLHDLIRSCRERLALKTGNILEDQELTLAFDHLGLMLVENARAAFAHSLNDVLEVYLHLYQNDGAFDIPPFSLSLTHQQFSSSLAVLKQAAETGQGISSFVPAAEEEQQEYYGEEDEHGAAGEDVPEDAQHAEEAQQYVGNQQGASDEAHGAEEPQAEGYANEEYQQEEDYQGQEYHGEEYAEDQVHGDEQHNGDTAEEQYVHEDYGGDEDLAAELAQAGEHTYGADEVDDASHIHPVEAVDATADHHTHDEQLPAPVDTTGGDGLEAASPASSQTVQGDDTTGSTELAADGQKDLTGLTEYTAAEDDAVALPAKDHADDALDYGEAQGDHDHADGLGDQAELDHTAAAHKTIPLGSEDFLEDEAYGFGAGEDDQQDQNGNEENYNQNEDHNDQADTYDPQQYEDEFHLPGEDDEQYHTAQDFLQGGDHEHGLEHDPNGEDYTGEHETTAANASNGNGYEQTSEQLYDDEDDIDFDDDTTEQHEARKASEANIAAAASNSPLGKRSFDQHADDELEFDDEPELKKVRAE